jgi:hypothetical protein
MHDYRKELGGKEPPLELVRIYHERGRVNASHIAAVFSGDKPAKQVKGKRARSDVTGRMLDEEARRVG